MTYLDTSILVSFFVAERKSPVVRGWLGSARTQDLTISEWTRTEFASAIGNRVRSRHVGRLEALNILQTFGHMADNSLSVIVPDPDDFRLACRYMEKFELGLRAGDALHLAIAMNHGAHDVCSLDRLFVEAGRKLGINVQIPV